MRRLIASLAVVFAATPFHVSAAADPPTCQAGLNGAFIICEGEASPDQGVSTALNQTPGSRSGSTIRWLPYNQLTTGADGQPCVRTAYYAEGSPPNDAGIVDPVTQNIRDIHNLPPLEYPPCPLQPHAPGDPPAVETPAMLAMRYWEQVPLPKPAPDIAPGRAITGKLAYLETNGEVSKTYTNPTVFGQLVISAWGSYGVNWGDGSSSGPHAFEGLSWPDGRITHEYQVVGSYDILVTESWTATWSLGGEQGTLRTLQTSGQIADFPVEQIQAVVR